MIPLQVHKVPPNCIFQRTHSILKGKKIHLKRHGPERSLSKPLFMALLEARLANPWGGQCWVGTRQWLRMKKYCLIFSEGVISPQNLIPICMETERIPVHAPDYTCSLSAVENISSKNFKPSKFEL